MNTNNTAPKGASVTITAVVEAYATGEYSEGPAFAHFTVTTESMLRLETLAALCTQHQLTEVRVSDSPNWGPEGVEDELRLRDGEMVVTAGDFWYTDVPRYRDGHIENRCLAIASLRTDFDAAANGDTLFYTEDADIRRMYQDAQDAQDTDN